MIAVVAAGGSGSRLAPSTRFINKHLIPVSPGKLMIDYPLGTIRSLGFSEAIVVTGSNHASQIVDYVGDGERYGFDRIEYAFQAKPAGIADVLKRIVHRASDDGVLLILGDNYFSQGPDFSVLEHVASVEEAAGFEYDLCDPLKAKAFGQAIRDESGRVIDIVEKPTDPQHGRILTGLYYFPQDVFEVVDRLSPSARNELEITHLLRMYMQESRLSIEAITGGWEDLGEWESLQNFWKVGG